ncbi:BnaA06g39050D [Brassica napus]|uniref:BnaA06g39050D protein n=1 Tax=Brassica napus TaxID=3708 RepID=A0A078J9C2_BRANA|nr:BnaA06g39050D [Brassica napus]
MKTVRADEFASRHSEDSIISMAARRDEQMSFLLSTIDQIDELQHRTNCHVKRSIFADYLLM